MRHWKLAPAALVSAGMLLSACGGGGEGKQPQSFDSSSQVLFNPVVTTPVQTQAIPLPFDALFSGFSTPTLNFPGLPAPLSDINQLDGFSTTAPIFADVAGFLDYSTVPQNIVIINTATGQALVPGTDFAVDNENATAQIQGSTTFAPISQQRSRILISPLKPLAPATQYLVALLTGIKTKDGNNVVPSSEFKIVSSTTPVAQQTDPTLAQFTEAQKEQLEALRESAILPVVTAFNQLAHIPTSSIALAWSFTTQSIDKSLKLVTQNASAGVIQVANTGLKTGQSGIPGLGLADVYAGLTTIPYYLGVPSAGNPTAPLTGYWHADPSKPDASAKFLGQVPCTYFAAGVTLPSGITLKPSASTTGCFPVLDASTASVQKVPVIVTAPNANSGQTKPAGGWPVVIFQHGITQNRTNAFAVADGLARAGFVVVAMDLPLHGITDTTSPLYHNQAFAGTPAAGLVTGERTFDLDLENNSTSAPGPDGKIDGSGTYFINLTSLITSRDNLREAVADLATLTQTVKTLSLSGGPVDVNPNRIYYFGHSLGGIVGGTLLGVNSTIRAAVLANPGGGVAKLLDASKTFGPIIAAGLGANGQAEGTDNFPNSPAYETFLLFAQTLVDSGDPVNYGAAASAGHAIHMIEVIDDQVVPNKALTTCPLTLPTITSTAQLVAACPATAGEDVTINSGYLSGTDPLAAAMGLTVIGPLDVPVANPVTKFGAQLEYVVQFSPGANGTVGHSTVLDPTHDPLVTQEMQSEAAQFLASDGQCLAIAGSCAP